MNIYVIGHPERSSRRISFGEISGTPIRKDGSVHLPILAAIPAAALTVTEFEHKLQERAVRFVVDPHVSTDILKYESQKFLVLGEVERPGVFPVDGDTTLMDRLGLAAGVLPPADLETAAVIRNGKLLPINVADVVRRVGVDGTSETSPLAHFAMRASHRVRGADRR